MNISLIQHEEVIEYLGPQSKLLIKWIAQINKLKVRSQWLHCLTCLLSLLRRQHLRVSWLKTCHQTLQTPQTFAAFN